MQLDFKTIRQFLKRTRRRLQMVQIQSRRDVDKYIQYINDPVAFAHEVLQIKTLTSAQEAILRSLLVPPYATLAPSGNEIGKTMTQAIALIWWHCTRSPSIVVSTGPKYDQLKDTLWKEIRVVARKCGLKLAFLPKACRIERGSDDFAVGTTAKGETAFKGQHGAPLLFLVDEASAVEPEIFQAIETMFSPPGHAMLVTFNCDAAGTFVHNELMLTERKDRPREGGREWHAIRQSAMDHPNIAAELRGEPPPIPNAIRLGKFEKILKKHSQLVGCIDLEDKAGLHQATDVIWPPVWATEYCERTRQTPRWWRPGPKAEVILFGRYPRQGSSSVYSDGDWYAATREGYDQLPIPIMPAEIGCDVAAQGADDTSITVRIGPCAVYHESYNGQREPETMKRLKELAAHYALFFNEEVNKLLPAVRAQYHPITERDIAIKIDNDGLGGTLSSFLEDEGYRVVRIGAGTCAIMKEDYPNRRSELWFTVAERARDNELDLSRLGQLADGQALLEEMRRQAMSVTWSFDNRGRRVVMSKDDMKQEMGGSPDELDSLNLAFAVDPQQSSNAQPEILTRRQGNFQSMTRPAKNAQPVAGPGGMGGRVR